MRQAVIIAAGAAASRTDWPASPGSSSTRRRSRPTSCSSTWPGPSTRRRRSSGCSRTASAWGPRAAHHPRRHPPGRERGRRRLGARGVPPNFSLIAQVPDRTRRGHHRPHGGRRGAPPAPGELASTASVAGGENAILPHVAPSSLIAPEKAGVAGVGATAREESPGSRGQGAG
jgi:hypothetical protein